MKGWMSQESFAEAEPDSAVILKNFFPEAEAVRARRGRVLHASGITGDVTSLLRFVSASASRLYAAITDKIYDVSSSGAVGAAVLSGLANGWWQQSMFATAAGQFLVMVNGANGVRTYDGTTWVDQSAAITGTAGAVTTFINLTAHKRRLWFVSESSMDLWYLATDAINGAASKFPVGSLFERGGYVMALGTYSIDSGDGMDDMFVIGTSEGEYAVYAGTDPASSNTWQLVSVFYVGDPIGRRSFFQVGGDLLVITEDGLLPISKALKIDRAVVGQEAISKNIRQAYVTAVQRSREQQGWEIVAFPMRNMGICNVPGSGDVPTQQFALNTITGAWGLFEGWNANCFAHFENALYFGGSNGVWRCEYGANDDGDAIQLELLPAFSHLKSPGRKKHIKNFRHYISTDMLSASYEVAVATDYEVPQRTSGTSAAASGEFFTWDETPWDGPAIWYGERTMKDWTGAANVGTVAAHYFRMSLDAAGNNEFKFRIIATDYLYEPGGV